MMRLTLLFFCLFASMAVAQFKLAPAVAVEAEDFAVLSGWKVVKNGEGNSMVDLIGFNHISGERLLHLPAKAKSAVAHRDITVPVAGDYRLWVRYEYAANTSTLFRVAVSQNGKVVKDMVCGRPDNPRYSFGVLAASGQNDMPYGPEGLHEEGFLVPGLIAGPARLTLEGVDQSELKPGLAADRNIDLLYLTSDTRDAWYDHYRKSVNLYPILEPFRDSVGPRWEVKLTNHGAKPATVRVQHVYNRIPWGFAEPATIPILAPGASSDWIGLRGQDTTHFSLITFSAGAEELCVELRPFGTTKPAYTFRGTPVRVYLPPYVGKGEEPTTPVAAMNRILAELKKNKAPGKVPTQPLCYGGWLPLGEDSEYGRKYAELYAALGFRSLHPAHSGPLTQENLARAGVTANKSWMAMGYRNPPTRTNIERSRIDLQRRKLSDKLRFFDYGDEISFGEWIGMMLDEEIAAAKASGSPLTADQAIRIRWIGWLTANRRDVQINQYWLPAWGPIVVSKLRPDSSAAAARQNPRLYVDSLLFYEDQAIDFAVKGLKDVKATLGEDVLCGANYSCHPFYYPSPTMYIKWFRRGAADLGRHSEYFWQVGQPGPMINGYISEHFRCGMRDDPQAVLRQYTMPHAPGNTDANFLRSCFTHLAHGATMLDFFGIGLNETFTENHIDHRALSRFKALRDVTHCVGFVEDLLPTARPVPSSVALLISESTERWDVAAMATDRAGHDHFGPNFNKARLHYHLDRLGMWKALTFAGHSPDLVTEQDVIDGKWGSAKVLIVVGDCWPREMVAALDKYVRAGGTVLATASAGMRDTYGTLNPAWHQLAGLAKVQSTTERPFLRPRIELPHVSALAQIKGDGWEMPALVTAERITPVDGTKVVARFANDGSAAMTERTLGKGKIVTIAAHPGLAYLHSALQPPVAPDRGAVTHSIPTKWDAGAAKLLATYLDPAPLIATPALIDARLLKAKGGYLLPLASYTGELAEKVTLRLRLDGVKKVSSAYHGELKIERGDGTITVVIPSLTYGDVLRLE